MPKVHNLTPHEITIVGDDGSVVARFPPSGRVVRLSTQAVPAGTVAGVPAVRIAFGDPEGLPENVSKGDVLIVSTLALAPVARALAGRGVIVAAPDTSPSSVVRDAEGRIIGVRRLQLADAD